MKNPIGKTAAFLPFSKLQPLIALAREEDLGKDDVTSRLMIGANALGRGTLVQKEPGVVCALPIVKMVCRMYDSKLSVEPIAGQPVEAIEATYTDKPRRPLLHVRGPMRSLLSAERVILNFLQRCGGVATHTHCYVQAVAGLPTRIVDTRKTLPGHRLLDKYAVRCGGGMNHRFGLYDGLLVKDNHLAKIPLPAIPAFVQDVVNTCRREDARRLVEVEVDTLDQLEQVLKVKGIDVILLDNMDRPTMRRAVKLRDQAGRRQTTALEASGGVTLKTVRAIAETGVERISIGALTHSAPALDIGLDIQ